MIYNIEELKGKAEKAKFAITVECNIKIRYPIYRQGSGVSIVFINI